MIQQVYEVDPLLCPKCGGTMKIISFIERHQSEVIERFCGIAACGSRNRRERRQRSNASGTEIKGGRQGGRLFRGERIAAGGSRGPSVGTRRKTHDRPGFGGRASQFELDPPCAKSNCYPGGRFVVPTPQDNFDPVSR